MDSQYIQYILMGLMGVVMWFLRTTLADVKDQLKEQRHELNTVKEQSFKKSDFIDFKTDLWIRLDEMKADFRRALDKQ